MYTSWVDQVILKERGFYMTVRPVGKGLEGDVPPPVLHLGTKIWLC